MRELEQKCESREAAASKRTVTRLQAQSRVFREGFIVNCCIDGFANLARCAIESQASPNTRGTAHTPVLIAAAQQGHARVVKVLLENGADHTLTGVTGCTALLCAAQCGRAECVRLLLGAGADAMKADHACGNTPLISAVAHKHVECARLLLPASDLGHYTKQGRTVLHASIMAASEECFELQLPLVDVDVRTIAGVEADGTPITVSFGRTALHIACEKGLFEFVKALLRAGTSPLARDRLEMASRR